MEKSFDTFNADGSFSKRFTGATNHLDGVWGSRVPTFHWKSRTSIGFSHGLPKEVLLVKRADLQSIEDLLYAQLILVHPKATASDKAQLHEEAVENLHKHFIPVD